MRAQIGLKMDQNMVPNVDHNMDPVLDHNMDPILGPFDFDKLVDLEICCRGMWLKYSEPSYASS